MTARAHPETRTAAFRRDSATNTRHPFHDLRPIVPDYALRPIVEGFNWADCAARAGVGEWYMVVFRSVRKSTADHALLAQFDELAYQEARTAPGFIFYFQGELTERRECLSFCLWERHYLARMASRRPRHADATSIVHDMYESYRLERYLVAKYPDRDSIELQPLL